MPDRLGCRYASISHSPPQRLPFLLSTYVCRRVFLYKIYSLERTREASIYDLSLQRRSLFGIERGFPFSCSPRELVILGKTSALHFISHSDGANNTVLNIFASSRDEDL